MAIGMTDVPMMIGQGAVHPAEIFRLQSYLATAGGTGIVGADDFRVTALPVPGGAVRIMPGACVMKSRYAGAVAQSYMVRQPVAVDLPIPPTGSGGGATYFIVAYVRDPEREAFTPANKQNGPYAFFDAVTSLATWTRPYHILAQVSLPANTGTVTSNMITSRREMVAPRRKRDVRMVPWLKSGTALTSTTFVDWPNPQSDHPVEIPEWASRVYVSAGVVAPWINKGKAIGQLRFQLGSQYSQAMWYHATAPEDGVRIPKVECADVLLIPPHLRGSIQYASVQGLRGASSTAGISLTADTYSTSVIDMEFVEAPNEDTF